MTDSTVPPVSASWSRIDAWLAAHAPASLARLRPGAGPAALARAEEALGMPLPADLAASLACHDGAEEGSGVLPDGVDLLSAEGVVEQWHLWNEVTTELHDGEEPWGVEGGQTYWHRRWIPVTHAQGDLQVVDLRPGPGQGRLGLSPHDGPGRFPADAWPSFGAYLHAVAQALTTGRQPDPPVFEAVDLHLGPAGELLWSWPPSPRLSGPPKDHGYRPAPVGP